MKKLGQNPTEAELVEMINSVDDNGDNEIDFNEFLVLMKSRIGEKDPDKELRDAFNVFDSDGSGQIDRKELKRLMKKLGQTLSDAELDAMMNEVDTDGDGEISFAEFKAMMVCYYVRLLTSALHRVLCFSRLTPLACTVFLYFSSELLDSLIFLSVFGARFMCFSAPTILCFAVLLKEGNVVCVVYWRRKPQFVSRGCNRLKETVCHDLV